MLLSLALLTPAHAAPIKIVSVTAESYYSKNGTAYFADGIKDGKTTPPWFEGRPGNGVGAWIQVDLGEPQDVTKITILAGDWSSGGDWQRANRPNELELKFSDGSVERWSLADEWKAQTFSFDKAKTTSTIRFKVNSLHNGTAFPDTAISEIMVFDDKPGSTVQVKAVTASSEFPSDNDGAYFASQAADGIRDTMWCEGDAETDGVGSWVEFDLGGAHTVSSMKICTGMCASNDIHKKGNAPSALTVSFSDGSSQKVTLKDFFLPQMVKFAAPHTASSVKLTIDGVRKGSEYDDACFSEVTFNR